MPGPVGPKFRLHILTDAAACLSAAVAAVGLKLLLPSKLGSPGGGAAVAGAVALGDVAATLGEDVGAAVGGGAATCTDVAAGTVTLDAGASEGGGAGAEVDVGLGGVWCIADVLCLTKTMMTMSSTTSPAASIQSGAVLLSGSPDGTLLLRTDSGATTPFMLVGGPEVELTGTAWLGADGGAGAARASSVWDWSVGGTVSGGS